MKLQMGHMITGCLGFWILASCQFNAPSDTPDPAPVAEEKPKSPYTIAIEKTAAMDTSGHARRMARLRGLRILDVTWEDTGRFKGSEVGPNISDMTIQVPHTDHETGELRVSAMPVIRFPNFSDRTTDIDPGDFTLLVGNQKGRSLKRVSLREFLERPTRYLSDPRSWAGSKSKTLLAERDSKVLVSAQACFLPVPIKGKATFNPVLFNYQSYEENPAVLTILATREGTSVTVIDNKRDAFENGSVWGQRLFHNANGQRASLTGTRASEFVSRPGEAAISPTVGGGTRGMNMVLLIQVPLKQRDLPRPGFDWMLGQTVFSSEGEIPLTSGMRFGLESTVEAAVIGHGDFEGPFTEIDDLPIERDSRYPIRVTVQFYKATSNGVVDSGDLSEIRREIGKVYRRGNSVGSLVTGGRTGRPTEYEGSKIQPAGWWSDFWQRHYENTGDTPAIAQAKLVALLGDGYMQIPTCELYLRDLLREAG